MTATVPIHADAPRAGFYKMRKERGGRWLPVAIWSKDGTLVCRVGPDMDDPMRVWTYCAQHKITKEAARFAFEHGYFEDEPAPRNLSNLPADPYDCLRLELNEDCARAEKLLKDHPTIKVSDQATCDLFVNLGRSITSLIKKADDLHEIEKRPHLEAGRAVDERFRFRASAKVIVDRLRQRYSAFMAHAERQQKAALEAKRKAEADRLAKNLADDPVAALTDPAPSLPLEEPKITITAGGGIGHRAGLRSVWIPTVTDYAQAAMFFIEHPDLKAAVDKLVKHAVRDGKGSTVIPGVTIKEDRVAI